MEVLIAKLRYFPLDAVSGPPVRIDDRALVNISSETGANVSLRRVLSGRRTEIDGTIREETMGEAMDEISQDIVTVAADNEERFTAAIRAIVRLYRAPRTVFGTWGSSERGNRILSELCDEDDGWA